jgi:hypothetical protein
MRGSQNNKRRKEENFFMIFNLWEKSEMTGIIFQLSGILKLGHVFKVFPDHAWNMGSNNAFRDRMQPAIRKGAGNEDKKERSQ